MSKSLVPKRNIFKSDFIGNAPKLKLSVRTCSFGTYATFVFIRSFELHDMFKLPHDTAMTKWVELNSHSVSKTFVVTCLEWARDIPWEYSRVHTQITIFCALRNTSYDFKFMTISLFYSGDRRLVYLAYYTLMQI